MTRSRFEDGGTDTEDICENIE